MNSFEKVKPVDEENRIEFEKLFVLLNFNDGVNFLVDWNVGDDENEFDLLNLSDSLKLFEFENGKDWLNLCDCENCTDLAKELVDGKIFELVKQLDLVKACE